MYTTNSHVTGAPSVAVRPRRRMMREDARRPAHRPSVRRTGGRGVVVLIDQLRSLLHALTHSV